MSTPERGRLFLVPNLLGLVSPDLVLPEKTLAATRLLKYFVVENAKAARTFLKSVKTNTPIQQLAISEIDDARTPADLEALLQPTLAGNDIGLLSDAGCPAIADPGARLVAAAHRMGTAVVPLVGPSAVLLGLMAAGCNGQNFAFNGYLPVAATQRLERLQALDRMALRLDQTQLFIETPYRNDAMIAAVLTACQATTQFCVALDLTLPTEQIFSFPILQWRERSMPSVNKRPALFVIGRGAV